MSELSVLLNESNKFSRVFENSLSYSDVFIIPQYSNITTRRQVDISSKLGEHNIEIPVISANMESVTDSVVCNRMRQGGALGALHRFSSKEEAVKDFLSQDSAVKNPVIVSVGVTRDSRDRAVILHEAGARYFIIDIAHGHSLNMKEMISFLKERYKNDIFIIAGNVATAEASIDLINWGADAIKCGVANGSICATKNVTGVVIPMVNTILSCKMGIQRQLKKKHVPLIADGGLVEIGDVCKAIGLGADFVMSGRLFAGCDESPTGLVYRGSASKEVQEKYRTDAPEQMPTPEGKSEILKESRGPIKSVLDSIAGGMRSSFSYVGAENINQFHARCKFGTRRQSQKN
jgi:IMP dehydrogenase